jgi:hypothetical protein
VKHVAFVTFLLLVAVMATAQAPLTPSTDINPGSICQIAAANGTPMPEGGACGNPGQLPCVCSACNGTWDYVDYTGWLTDIQQHTSGHNGVVFQSTYTCRYTGSL